MMIIIRITILLIINSKSELFFVILYATFIASSRLAGSVVAKTNEHTLDS